MEILPSTDMSMNKVATGNATLHLQGPTNLLSRLRRAPSRQARGIAELKPARPILVNAPVPGQSNSDAFTVGQSSGPIIFVEALQVGFRHGGRPVASEVMFA